MFTIFKIFVKSLISEYLRFGQYPREDITVWYTSGLICQILEMPGRVSFCFSNLIFSNPRESLIVYSWLIHHVWLTYDQLNIVFQCLPIGDVSHVTISVAKWNSVPAGTGSPAKLHGSTTKGWHWPFSIFAFQSI